MELQQLQSHLCNLKLPFKQEIYHSVDKHSNHSAFADLIESNIHEESFSYSVIKFLCIVCIFLSIVNSQTRNCFIDLIFCLIGIEKSYKGVLSRSYLRGSWFFIGVLGLICDALYIIKINQCVYFTTHDLTQIKWSIYIVICCLAIKALCIIMIIIKMLCDSVIDIKLAGNKYSI